MRVRAEAMRKRSIKITVLDVDPESNTEVVKKAMENYGEVKRCKRMTMSGIWSKVLVNKVNASPIWRDALPCSPIPTPTPEGLRRTFTPTSPLSLSLDPGLVFYSKLKDV